MTFREFLKTPVFKKNALAALGITIFLVILNMLVLRLYTGHGDSVEIPDLKGRSIDEVYTVLDRVNLKYSVRDSVYSPGSAPGTVLDQYPKPGMKVKEDRTIFITMSTFVQENISMPQLTDISYRQAINIIESSGLVAGSVQYKKSEFPNLVLEQRIGGQIVMVGESIPKGSVVDLVLGSDSNGENSELPTLFGRNLAEARLLLGEALLNVGLITYDESVNTEDQKLKALIWKQSPDPAEIFELESGASIDVWLTIDPEKLQAKPETEKPENSFF